MSFSWVETKGARVFFFACATLMMSLGALIVRFADDERALPSSYIVACCIEAIKGLISIILRRRTIQDRLHQATSLENARSKPASTLSPNSSETSKTTDIGEPEQISLVIRRDVDALEIESLTPDEVAAKSDEVESDLEFDFKKSWMFAVPAIFYSIDNNLFIIVLLYIQPATFQILINSKIIITAVLYWKFLGRKPTTNQFAALILLVTGVILTHYHEDEISKQKQRAAKNFSFGLFLTVIMGLSSSMANVWSERLYKHLNQNIHVQNIQLYGYGTLINVGLWVLSGERNLPQSWWLFIAVILVSSLSGLCISFLLKFTDNIVNIFAHSASMIFTLIVSVFFFGFSASVPFLCGLTVVLVAGFIYHSEENNNAR